MPNQLRVILLLLAALLPAGGARPRAQTDQFILPDDLETVSYTHLTLPTICSV